MSATAATLAERLRAILAKKQMTQHELALLIGTNDQYVARVLAGRMTPRVDRVAAIAKALGTTVDKLVA